MNDHIIDKWNLLSPFLYSTLFLTSVMIVISYIIAIQFIRTDKGKYDFIARFEVRVFTVASIICIAAGLLFFNAKIERIDAAYLLGKLFLSVSLSIIAAFIVLYFLKVYYPHFLEKRLAYFRFRPRISPKTGKPMKRLSEAEEDIHLHPGMQMEEKLHSFDYDVWRDDETGFVVVEKYSSWLQSKECPKCGFHTLKMISEEISREPIASIPGELVKHYVCSYCKFKTKTQVRIT